MRASWSGIETRLVPESELKFFAKMHPTSLQFTKDAQGNVTQLVFSDNERWTKVK